MKALIIGAAGFVGNYLVDHLQNNCKWSTVVTKLPHEKISNKNVEAFDLDILKIDDITQLLQKVCPDYIFHLAAQSSVALSWKNPTLTIDVNIKGAVIVLDAVRTLDYKPKVLLIGSGEEYGHVKNDEMPVNECNRTRPGNIYAATKVAQNMIGKIYADAYNMDIIMVRAFNHIGPNQSPQFVVADFCKQVAEIEAGEREPVIHVGNLNAVRDFTDVRDVVRAYAVLIQKGRAGETYNIGGGKVIAIKDILNMILSLSCSKIAVQAEESRMRPVDVPIIEADTSKIRNEIGWKPEISLEQTIEETLNYWRQYKN
jgi:GDP-4-dehydro-6-deoxy-D-mannose reductase